MICVCECSPATDGDEARVAVFRKDHGCTPFTLSKKDDELETLEFSPTSVRDVAHAQAITQQVSCICQELCEKQRVKEIHLYVAVPNEFAVLIGHPAPDSSTLNGMMRLCEWMSEDKYLRFLVARYCDLDLFYKQVLMT